jgi:dTMP kinase
MARLIAIEGIDGSGKGTQTSLLVNALNAQEIRTGTMQFPRYSATHFGAAIGSFLNGKFGSLQQVHPQLASVLYAGDRFESKPVLQQLMADHDVVVLDRFVGSNLAHQGAKLAGNERRELVKWIETIEFEVFRLPQPDYTILIDMSSSWSHELVRRKATRDYTDKTADLQEADSPYLERVRQCYLEIAADRDSWKIIRGLTDDGQLRSVDHIAADILKFVSERLSSP